MDILLYIILGFVIYFLIKLNRNVELIATSMRMTQSTGVMLKSICEKYWAYKDPGPYPAEKVSETDYREAVEALLVRPETGADWALENLKHHSDEARRVCAYLVGEYFKYGTYEENINIVVEQLGEVAWKVGERDRGELQSVREAITALGKAGTDEAREELTRIIQTNSGQFSDSLKLTAVESLEKLTGVQFVFEDDPVDAAIQWVREKET